MPNRHLHQYFSIVIITIIGIISFAGSSFGKTKYTRNSTPEILYHPDSDTSLKYPPIRYAHLSLPGLVSNIDILNTDSIYLSYIGEIGIAFEPYIYQGFPFDVELNNDSIFPSTGKIYEIFNGEDHLIKEFPLSLKTTGTSGCTDYSGSSSLINDSICFVNKKCNFKKKEFRVLDIGNSYTSDATSYLQLLTKAANIDVSDMALCTALRGGAGFKTWADIYNGLHPYEYSIQKILGGLSCSGLGTGKEMDGSLFKKLLSENEFDLILIHPSSKYATSFERWSSDDVDGGLPELLSILRRHQPDAYIGCLLIHSYESGYELNTEHDSYNRWKAIADAIQLLIKEYNIDFIIPYGTAIQNLRASSLNNSHDLTSDGTHCADGIADYTASCTYYESVIGKRYGISVLGNKARTTSLKSEEYPSVIVTDSNAYICQRAAVLACTDPFTVTNPEIMTDPVESNILQWLCCHIEMPLYQDRIYKVMIPPHIVVPSRLGFAHEVSSEPYEFIINGTAPLSQRRKVVVKYIDESEVLQINTFETSVRDKVSIEFDNDNWKPSKIIENGIDVTDCLSDNGGYVSSNLYDDLAIEINLEYNGSYMFNISTDLFGIEAEGYRIYSDKSNIYIDNCNDGDEIRIYSIAGLVIKEEIAHSPHLMITLPPSATYILTINGIACKLRI